MKKPRSLTPIGRVALGLTLALCHASLIPVAFAEDIDIYQGTVQGGAPNVVFFLDNTSNWSSNAQGWDADSLWNGYTMTGNVPVKGCKDQPDAARTTCQTLIKQIYYTGSAANRLAPWEPGYKKNNDNVELFQGQVQLRALRLVLNRLVCSGGADALKVNVGLELIKEQTTRNNGDSNGIINFAVRPLKTTDDSCKVLIERLSEIDAQITEPKWKAPSSPDYGAALFEVFKYFGGYANPAGAQTEPTTKGSPWGASGYGPDRFSKVNELDDELAFEPNSSRLKYKSPITSEGACARNFVVLVGNTYPNAEPKSSPAQFSGLNYSPPPLPAGSSDPGRSADEWAYFLANTDVSPVPGVQRVFTYTINTYKNAPSSDQARLLRSMAAQGGVGPAGYLEVGGDLNKMVAALSDILTSIAAVDSVFTAATLPVSTTTQGTYLNQVFVGLFRPDENAKPRWVGNLKQYKLGLDSTSGDVMLVDAYDNPAILRGTGFFSPLARSYWTKDSVFFYHMPSGTPLSISDSPDGQIVEKGGAAQQLRIKYAAGASGRNVLTLNSGGGLAPFDSTNTAVTGVFGASEISWIRGENTGLTETPGAQSCTTTDPITCTDFGPTGPRASIHGDVLHSRPVALNYGGGDIVVFYGGNDGFLRAVSGRQTGSAAGQELWSFVAPEFYQPLLKRLQSNSPPLLLPSTDDKGQPITPSAGTARKNYGMDGPIGVFAHYRQEVMDGKKVNVVDEAIIYATMRRGGRAVYALDVSPTYRTAPILKWKIDNTSTGFGKLGQTWSMPKAVNFPGYSDPIVIMGGGYDPLEDENRQSNPKIGNAIFVINGKTGEKLAELPTEYAVAGDVAVADTDYNGVIDRGYVADVHGYLYRIDFTIGGAWVSPENWTIKQIAYLGGKVFTTPDIVSTSEFVAILIGTGDREKPLLISTRDNFFMIKDKTIAQAKGGDWVSPLTKSDLTRFAEVDENTGSLSNINTSVADNEGCYIELGTNGEKVVNSPYSIAGNTYFGTNRPTPSTNSCTGNLGQARTYVFPLFCRANPTPPKSIVLDSGGMPPSPVGGLVTITVDGVDRVVPFIIGAGTGGSPFEAERPRPPIPPVRTRQYWKIDNSNR